MSELCDDLKRLFNEMSPYLKLLGFELEELDPTYALARLSYSADLVGDPRTGVIHGGVVTTLLDTAGGAVVLAASGQLKLVATLDLRVDYLRPARKKRDIYGRVECYRLAREVAFVRGVAFEQDLEDPIASMAATYMTQNSSVTGTKEGAHV